MIRGIMSCDIPMQIKFKIWQMFSKSLPSKKVRAAEIVIIPLT